MGLEYLQLWADMEALFEPYDDAQRGRLMMAMMAYAYRHEEPEFTGVEKFIWPVLRQHIDRCAQNVEAKKAAGSKGGKGSKSNNQTGAEEINAKQLEANRIKNKQSEAEVSKAKQTEADESESKQNAHTQYHNHNHDHEHNHNHVVVDTRATATTPEKVTGIDGSDLSESIRLNAEVDVLLKKYNLAEYNRDGLMDEIAKHGLDKVKRVMHDASESDKMGGLSLKFIRACLANDGKPKPVCASPSVQKDQMMRYSAEERKKTYSAAVLDFDEVD